MKYLAVMLVACSFMLAHPSPSRAQVTNTNVAVTAPVNTNTSTDPKKQADFRDPPALIPLLLVPAAIALYFLYEKISRRTQP